MKISLVPVVATKGDSLVVDMGDQNFEVIKKKTK